jgi:butyrate kinase
MATRFVVLAINPGSTSTKIAVFEDDRPLVEENLSHSAQELAEHRSIWDQYEFREQCIREALGVAGIQLGSLDAVVGRGGILRPLIGGTYLVNEQMLADLRGSKEREHASNLGAQLAWDTAASLGIPAYVVDPVSIDEFEPVARIAGLPEIERRSLSHALNLRSTALRAAKDLNRSYASLGLVVVHMGGGISVSAHRDGRMIDVNQALDGTGPFSPERAGGLPIGDVLRMAFSVYPHDRTTYDYDTLFRRVVGGGGLVAHLGTNDAREVERRISAGESRAKTVYQAMAYQIAKEIGAMACAVGRRLDAVVLTGGLAHSSMLVGWISSRVDWIAPVLCYPGQDEMLSMVEGTLRVLKGTEPAKKY